MIEINGTPEISGTEFSMVISRRDCLLSLSALASGFSTQCESADTVNATRIDFHHHVVPPKWLAAKRDFIIRGGRFDDRPLLNWSPERSIEEMDKSGIRTAFLSLSSPGVWFENIDESRGLARDANEFAAQAVSDHPRRFGTFAALPLPDVDACLREIEYALDTLKADGIGLLTSYGGQYLGDPAFKVIFDELNRRNAVVYTHPTGGACCKNVIPGVPRAVEEFAFDTTRTITSLLYAGTFARCQNIKFVFSQGGGTLPFLADRIALPVFAGPGAAEQLRKLYFETNTVTNAPSMAALLKFVPVTQLLLGTDYPYTPTCITAVNSLHKLVQDGGLTAAEARAIEFESALRLFPRLKS
jgi:predicted TIM-barrel fold metal-dependent hydrolase